MPTSGTAQPVRGHRPQQAAGLLPALTMVYYFLYEPVEVALPLYVTGPLRSNAALLGLFLTVFGVSAIGRARGKRHGRQDGAATA